MFYKAENLEETIKAMSNNKPTHRDTRFTKLNPYKWIGYSKIDDEKTCEVCAEKGI